MVKKSFAKFAKIFTEKSCNRGGVKTPQMPLTIKNGRVRKKIILSKALELEYKLICEF